MNLVGTTARAWLRTGVYVVPSAMPFPVSVVLQAAPGIDPSTFWLVISAMGTTISSLAVLIWKTERDRRIEAEKKLEAYEKEATGTTAEMRRLAAEVRRAQSVHTGRAREDLPFPLGRPSSRPARRRP